MSAAFLSVFTLYADPSAAVGWLSGAFGFEVVNEFGDDRGTVHAELRLGETVIIVERAAPGQAASPVVERSTVRAPVLCLRDEAAVDALFDRIVTFGGGSVVREPETTAWGNHRFEVLDPEGHQWSVGSYVPGTAWE